MKIKEKTAAELKEELFSRYPQLESCRKDFDAAYALLLGSYRAQGQLLVCGNGGSAADSEHIVGELMKSFLFYRKTEKDFDETMAELYGADGTALASMLEGALPALPLTSMTALTSAFANDVDAAVSFAQMVYGYGRKGDVLLGISTSGNSRNVVYALMTARARGLHTIALTGQGGGKCKGLAEVTICVPETETFKIQELHLPVYHALCGMLEADLFEEKEN